jgi:hypothetical protein
MLEVLTVIRSNNSVARPLSGVNGGGVGFSCDVPRFAEIAASEYASRDDLAKA